MDAAGGVGIARHGRVHGSDSGDVLGMILERPGNDLVMTWDRQNPATAVSKVYDKHSVSSLL